MRDVKTTKRVVVALKILLWLGALTPTVWMAAGAYYGWLGANPIEKLEHVSGMTALITLLATLLVTPVRRLSGWNPVIQLRRPMGLFGFYYVFMHFGLWMGLDLGFEFSWVAEDIAKRPYITVGFTGFLLLIPLALTSTRGAIRRLGKRWTKLHRLAYVVPALGVIHYYWSVKADVRIPLLLGGIYTVLMLVRVPRWVRGRGQKAPRASRSQGPSRRPAGSSRQAREALDPGTVPVGAGD